MFNTINKGEYYNNLISLGNSLVLVREQKKLSQSRLAEEAQISEKTISHIENFHGNPTISTVYSLCSALNFRILVYNPEYLDNIFTKKTQNVLSENTIDFISFM